MLAYAASRPRVGARQSSPNALLFVICGHIVLLAVAMSVKMALPPKINNDPTAIIRVPVQKPPPPVPPDTRQRTTSDHALVQPRRATEIPTTVSRPVPLDFGRPSESGETAGGAGTIPLPPLPPLPPQPVGASKEAQLLTPPSELRPPYPQSKLLAGEEAALRLRLTIDESGRVVAVDPVGRADPVFLAAARRHLLSHWRYRPAIKDGRAVPTSIVISLRFQLDG
jgi:periplasmic protein TonB